MSTPSTPEQGPIHRIVSEARKPRDVPRYTCACGETIDADPSLLGEALALHIEQEARRG